MTRARFASLVLATALFPAAMAIAQDKPAPPPTRPAGGGGGTGNEGGVRGPAVPPGSEKGDREFKGGRGRDAAREQMENRMWMAGLDKISDTFGADQKTKIEGIKAEMRKTQEEWQKANGEKIKELQQKMRDSAKNGGAPDEKAAGELKKLMETRPKSDTFQQQIWATLTPEQQAAHKKAVEELKKQNEEQRKARQDGKGGEMKPGGAPGDGNPPPPGGRGRGKGGAGGAGGGTGGAPPQDPKNSK